MRSLKTAAAKHSGAHWRCQGHVSWRKARLSCAASAEIGTRVLGSPRRCRRDISVIIQNSFLKVYKTITATFQHLARQLSGLVGNVRTLWSGGRTATVMWHQAFQYTTSSGPSRILSSSPRLVVWGMFFFLFAFFCFLLHAFILYIST